MKCAKIKILLPEYSEHALGDADHSLVSEHIATCEDCRQEYQSLEKTFRVIRKESSWIPSENYWQGLLPRIHQRREIMSEHSMSEWIVRFAAPFALAVLLIFFSLRIFSPGPMNDTQSSPAVLSELSQQELQEYLHHQSVVGLVEQSDAKTGSLTPSVDKVILKELVQEDGKYLAVFDADDESLFASITDQEAENIVNILENK